MRPHSVSRRKVESDTLHSMKSCSTGEKGLVSAIYFIHWSLWKASTRWTEGKESFTYRSTTFLQISTRFYIRSVTPSQLSHEFYTDALHYYDYALAVFGWKGLAFCSRMVRSFYFDLLSSPFLSSPLLSSPACYCFRFPRSFESFPNIFQY